MHIDLKIVVPSFESPLTDLIIELDYLRRKRLGGTTPPFIFFQIKQVFHMLESLASARIEGNVTTVADYVESKISAPPGQEAAYQEIRNMEECLSFIDSHVGTARIDRAFVSELHKMTVKNLPLLPAGEGDETPGQFRSREVRIKNSPHTPPDPTTVSSYMDELFQFIERDDLPKYDLLKVAIAHHRFVWIHPFSNGNGRTVRLFTYAMLVKYGFAVDKGRILNPAAVFCSNRDAYYDNLARADQGTDQGILAWCEYVLGGLKVEIEKIDRLLEYSYLTDKVLLPAIDYAIERELITDIESKILKRTIEKQKVKAADLSGIVSSQHRSELSRLIARLKSKKMLAPFPDSPRRYMLCFGNNYLLRGIINALRDEGFVSLS